MSALAARGSDTDWTRRARGFPERVDVSSGRALFTAVLAQVRVLALAGIPTGVVVAGIGSRLAMLALRLTSPDAVIGRQSDDDFTIGRFTLGGTYNLMLIGAAVGVIGAAAYQLVAPRLLGPRWFCLATVGLASGAVVGSMLVHADGVDFVVLEPMWFAVGLFVLLPAAFAVAIGAAVDRVTAVDPSTSGPLVRWLFPVALAVCFPVTLVLLAFAAAAFAAWLVLRDGTPVGGFLRRRGPTFAVRALWLLVAVAGLLALVEDVGQLT